MRELTDTGYWCEEVLETSEDGLPVWGGNDGSTLTEARLAGRLSLDQRATLQVVLEVFSNVFQNKPGRTSVIEHVIGTGLAQPVRLPPYRLPHAYRQAVKDELEEMISSGIIEPAASEWSAPIVLVKKRDGSLLLCVDYRRLNQVSTSDAYSMPRVDRSCREVHLHLKSGPDTRLLAGPCCSKGPAQDSFFHSIWTLPI